MAINRKACGQFMHWWQKTDHNRNYYAYIDWNGNLLLRDVYHERTVAGVYEVDGKCKFVINGNKMLFDRVEMAHIKWLVEESNARSSYQC